MVETANNSHHQAHLASIADQIFQHASAGDLADWQPAPSEEFSRVFGNAFDRGGLDAVDKLIEDINVILIKSGSKYTIAPGAACELATDGTADSLMLYYQFSGQPDPICNQWIALKNPEQLPEVLAPQMGI